MMILNAHFGNRWHNAETAEEVAGLISELIPTLEYYHPVGAFTHPGDDALLCFADERFTHSVRETYGRKGHLVVAVNKETGYGALMWYWSAKDPVWVTDNPQPPDFDPRVVSDSGYPLFHSPSSTLPVKQFQEALEEFCYSGTGDRPASVDWVRGDPCGRRMDGGYYDRVEITSDRFAGEGVGRGMTGYVIEQWPDEGLWVEVMNPDGFTATQITAETGDLRLLTRGSVGIWPFLYVFQSPFVGQEMIKKCW